MANISAEEYYRDRAEYYCYMLRDAMIDLSLKFPELETFQHLLSKINNFDTFIYILSLLHKCGA